MSLSPDSIDSALKDHVELQVESATLKQELKRYKKLLLTAEKTIQTTVKERNEMGSSQLRMTGNHTGRERDLQSKLEVERRNREDLEKKLRVQERELLESREQVQQRGNNGHDREDSRVRNSPSHFFTRPETDKLRRPRSLDYGRSLITNGIRGKNY